MSIDGAHACVSMCIRVNMYNVHEAPDLDARVPNNTHKNHKCFGKSHNIEWVELWSDLFTTFTTTVIELELRAQFYGCGVCLYAFEIKCMSFWQSHLPNPLPCSMHISWKIARNTKSIPCIKLLVHPFQSKHQRPYIFDDGISGGRKMKCTVMITKRMCNLVTSAINIWVKQRHKIYKPLNTN